MTRYFPHIARRSGLDHGGGPLDLSHRRRRGADNVVEITTRETDTARATTSSVGQEEAGAPFSGGIEVNEVETVASMASPAPRPETGERPRPHRTGHLGSTTRGEVGGPPVLPSSELPEHAFSGPNRERQQTPLAPEGDPAADNAPGGRQTVSETRSDPAPRPLTQNEPLPAADGATGRLPVEADAKNAAIPPPRPDARKPAKLKDGPATVTERLALRINYPAAIVRPVAQTLGGEQVAEASSPVAGPVTAGPRVQDTPVPAQEGGWADVSGLPEVFPAARSEPRGSGAEVRIGAITLEVHQTANDAATPTPPKMAPRITREHAPPLFRASRHYLRGT